MVFFDEHMDALGHGLERKISMRLGWTSHDDGVERACIEHMVEVVGNNDIRDKAVDLRGSGKVAVTYGDNPNVRHL